MKKLLAITLSLIMTISSFGTFPLFAYADDNVITVNESLLASSSLAKPTGVKSTAKSAGSIKVTWKKVSGAKGYYIYRSTSKSKNYKKVAALKGGSTTSYVNKSLSSGKTYYYKVRAYSGKKTSSYSSASYAKTKSKKSSKKSTKKSSSSGTVYITDTGSKYHRANCRTLKKSKYRISKSKAKSQGYTACKVCKP
ncbi:MAG: fibronectin type III domain-containing protein [Oscillospiraceae bacterium]|nr:fibronectin type III domain-containing protein [Oscillospiraceae bacterium]